MKKNFKAAAAALTGFALVAMTSVANAAAVAAIDVGDIEDSFSNQAAPITAVLVASLGLAVLVAAFHWIRRVAK